MARSKPASSRFWPYAANRPDDPPGAAGRPARESAEFAAYSDLMSHTQALVAEEVARAYPFHRRRCLMDVGGGDGVFIATVAKYAPRLAFKLFDLPQVAARAHVSRTVRTIEAIGGDMLSDALPRGADVISLVRVLLDHDDESAAIILAAVHDALPREGVVVVAEPMAGEPGAEAVGDAYFGFYLFAMGRGRPRTFEESVNLLNQAGFARVRRLKTRNPVRTSAICAVPSVNFT